MGTLRVTIKDVAQRVGVNPSTVSRVINNDPKLSIREETKQKILATIEELGYRPNSIARGLRLRSSGAVGVLIPDITNPFFPEVIKGAESAAAEEGFSLILATTGENPQKEKNLIRLLIDRRVDGILLASAHLQDETISEAQQSGIPYVLVNRGIRNNVGAFVTVNNAIGAKLAVQHLVELGHTRIGHIAGFIYTETGLERLEGYRKALNQAGLPFVSEYMVEAGFSEQEGYKAMKKLLALPESPTGIFTANDVLAIGAMRAVYDSGLRVPDDISIVGYNDIWLANRITPALTTVNIPLYEMGYLSMKILSNKINGIVNEVEGVILNTELVIRESTSHPTERRVPKAP